ncbi:MAG: patatin-like phospholipase family protein [Haliea sp.]|nr:patatin-like phospholipase family protein [Haliea sp.]
MKNKSWLASLLAGLLCFVSNQAAHSSESLVAQAERPKIGLALSGGGARGAAHVGVLKVLEEMRIPIDFIAGTSMGSIIGGLYASGMTPEEIQKGLNSMDWEHIFSDTPPRKNRSLRRKRDDELYLVNASIGLSDEGELKFPTGAIQGQKFGLALRQLTMSVTTITDFDQLHIPFRAVAADIGSGQKVVLSGGDLATAMRASMAVPGIFAATEIDGRLLVDGGITDNLPIDVVRDMGADIVIAVDIGSPGRPAADITNLFMITEQLISIMTRTNVEQQIATLTERDVFILPELEGFSSSDFANTAAVIPLGRQGAEAQRHKLGHLGLSESAYQGHIAARVAKPLKQDTLIEFVQIQNDSGVGDHMILSRLNQTIGEPLDLETLEQDIARIYGLELFQSVSFDLVEQDDKTGLLIDARARSWGPNYLQFGVELTNDMRGNSSYNLGASYLRTSINSLGAEVRLLTQVGEAPVLGLEWHQPLDTLSQYFVAARVNYSANNVTSFGDSGAVLAEYRVNDALAEVAFGREFNEYGEARAGYRYRTGEAKLKTGSIDPGSFDYDGGQLFARVSVDRLDNYTFPNEGWAALLEYNVAREDVGSDTSFDQLKIQANRFATFGDGHVLGLSALLNVTQNGDASIQDQYRLGGFLNLSGYVEDSLVNQQAGMVSAMYYRRFRSIPFMSWYIGGSLEHGGVWRERDDLFNDGITAASLFLGADTPIGPVYLGYGHAEQGLNTLFFYFGRPPFN